jgi:hypothetical protein
VGWRVLASCRTRIGGKDVARRGKGGEKETEEKIRESRQAKMHIDKVNHIYVL